MLLINNLVQVHLQLPKPAAQRLKRLADSGGRDEAVRQFTHPLQAGVDCVTVRSRTICAGEQR